MAPGATRPGLVKSKWGLCCKPPLLAGEPPQAGDEFVVFGLAGLYKPQPRVKWGGDIEAVSTPDKGPYPTRIGPLNQYVGPGGVLWRVNRSGRTPPGAFQAPPRLVQSPAELPKPHRPEDQAVQAGPLRCAFTAHEGTFAGPGSHKVTKPLLRREENPRRWWGVVRRIPGLGLSPAPKGARIAGHGVAGGGFSAAKTGQRPARKQEDVSRLVHHSPVPRRRFGSIANGRPVGPRSRSSCPISRCRFCEIRPEGLWRLVCRPCTGAGARPAPSIVMHPFGGPS